MLLELKAVVAFRVLCDVSSPSDHTWDVLGNPIDRDDLVCGEVVAKGLEFRLLDYQAMHAIVVTWELLALFARFGYPAVVESNLATLSTEGVDLDVLPFA